MLSSPKKGEVLNGLREDPGLERCPHRPPCPGCPRFGERGIVPSASGALEELARLHNLPPVRVVSGQTAGFRHRARLAIRGRLGTPKLGLFESGTHRVVHIPNCSVHHPLINHVANVVRRALVDAKVAAFSEAAHLGLARYLQVVVERSSQTAQVVMVANSASPEPLDRVRESNPRTLGKGSAQLMVQCESRARQHNSGSGFPRLVRSGKRRRTIWRSGGALSAGGIWAKQPGNRAAHHRARSRASPGRFARCGILCRAWVPSVCRFSSK